MKNICLIRHAKSSKDNPLLDDFDRPLNDRGNSDAPNIAHDLKSKQIHFDLILSSPSKRTKQTAKHLCETIDYKFSEIEWVDELYHASPGTILEQIKEVNTKHKSIAIIGHNPGLTELGNLLVKDFKIDNLPTCSVLSIDFEIESWKDIKNKKGIFNFFVSPKEKRYLYPIK